MKFGHTRPLDSAPPVGRAPVFALPMDVLLNDHPALHIELAVTDPSPPLRICGGIIALRAENPDDKDTWLTFQIVSAHRSKNSARGH